MTKNQRMILSLWKRWGYKIIELNDFIIAYKFDYMDMFHACNGSKHFYVVSSPISKCYKCDKEVSKNLIGFYKLLQLKNKIK